jgi:hypothetical protein
MIQALVNTCLQNSAETYIPRKHTDLHLVEQQQHPPVCMSSLEAEYAHMYWEYVVPALSFPLWKFPFAEMSKLMN